ncbi:MAG TPA: PTS mannose transporter subunit IIAB [Anaerolineaceae bacterium]|nr:PTS mannose transporter subunit IIAB [Anaerolineaceae bacterium]
MSSTNQNETLGILVCTHSTLAGGFKQAIEMLMGPQENFETIGLYEGDDIMDLSKKIIELIQSMQTHKNVIFTDLFGASPTNSAAMTLVDINASIVTGVNLPMLAEILTLRNQQLPFEDLLMDIVAKGKDNIRIITKEMILEG